MIKTVLRCLGLEVNKATQNDITNCLIVTLRQQYALVKEIEVTHLLDIVTSLVGTSLLMYFNNNYLEKRLYGVNADFPSKH